MAKDINAYELEDGGLFFAPNEEQTEYANGGTINPSWPKPTATDSLNLYNNAVKVLDYYKKNNNYVELLNPSYNKEDIFSDLDIYKEKFNKYNKDKTIKYPLKNGKSTTGTIPTSMYYEELSPYQFKQREGANIILDTRAPMSLYDLRINPAFNNSFRNVNVKDSMFDDGVVIDGYDPIAVKPYKLLTSEERKLREQRYGKPVSNITKKPKSIINKVVEEIPGPKVFTNIPTPVNPNYKPRTTGIPFLAPEEVINTTTPMIEPTPVSTNTLRPGLQTIGHQLIGDNKLVVKGPGVKNGSQYMTFDEYEKFAKDNADKYNFSAESNSVGYVYKPGVGITKYANGGYKYTPPVSKNTMARDNVPYNNRPISKPVSGKPVSGKPVSMKGEIKAALGAGSLFLPPPFNYGASVLGSGMDFYDAYNETDSDVRNGLLAEASLGLIPYGKTIKVLKALNAKKAIDVVKGLKGLNQGMDTKDVLNVSDSTVYIPPVNKNKTPSKPATNYSKKTYDVYHSKDNKTVTVDGNKMTMDQFNNGFFKSHPGANYNNHVFEHGGIYFEEGGSYFNDPVSAPGQQFSMVGSLEQRKKQYEDQLRAEEERVAAARARVIPIAREAAVHPEYRKQIFKTKLDFPLYCSTRSCELERAAGYTTPNDLDVYGRKIPAGSKVPVITGTDSFDRLSSKMGYQEIPYNQATPGDRVIQFSPYLGSNHSMIFAGNDGFTENPGAPYFYYDSGIGNDFKYNDYPIDFNNSNYAKAYKYVGDTPRLQNNAYNSNRMVNNLIGNNGFYEEGGINQFDFVRNQTPNVPTNFEQRMYHTPYIDNEDGSMSSHKMMSWSDENGEHSAPTIVYKNNQLVELTPEEAIDYAYQTGEYKTFNNFQDSLDYGNNGYKYGTPMEMFAPNQEFEPNALYGGRNAYANGGYTVTRSSDRKGKTHKVTGPDGTVKYFGDSNLGQHPKDEKRKAAFYARHKSNLAGNPYFRAFARKTWEDGGEINNDKEMLEGVSDILSRVDDKKNRKRLADYMMANFRDENVSFQPNEFLEDSNVLAYGGMIDEYAMGGPIKPTFSDSLNIYNAAIKTNDFYSKNKDYEKGQFSPYKAYSKDHSKLIKDYNDIKLFTGPGPSKDAKRLNPRFGTNYTDSDLSNKYKNIGNLTGVSNLLGGFYDEIYNPNVPVTYLHPGILPQEMRHYASIKYSDVADVPYYDPLAIKPYKLLTPAERKLREQKYGKSKPVVSKPKPKPKPKPVSNLVEVLNTVTPVVEEPTVVNSTSKPSTTTTTPSTSTTTSTTTPTTTTTKKTMTANPTKWFRLDGSGNNIGMDGKYITRDEFEKYKLANPNFNYSQIPDSIGRVYENGGMIKRADGSYSERGLWDNIRANKGSGRKPTNEMLKQEKKIKSEYSNGGVIETEDGGLFFKF